MPRIDGRKNDELRTVEIIPHINKFAEGSCLIRCGNTHVLCTASVEDRPPRHVPEGEGWVTAEYSMLPRANRERSRRDISKLKLNGRSAEIQRLIGRALRSVVDMKKLGPWNITIDCDVLQGDGGTRTASITGGFVAMMLAFRKMMEAGQLAEYPVSGYVASSRSRAPARSGLLRWMSSVSWWSCARRVSDGFRRSSGLCWRGNSKPEEAEAWTVRTVGRK